MKLIFISIMLIFISGCKSNGESDQKQKSDQHQLSFYSWSGVSNYKKVLNNLENYQKPVIYLSPSDNGNESRDNFISNINTLHSNGSAVWELISGHPSSSYINEQIALLVNYNNNHNKKVIGISFDIEPWTKFKDQNSSDNIPAWQDYLDFLSSMAESLHSNNLKLSVSIPFWLNKITKAFPTGRNLNYEVVDRVDETIIMDYTIFKDRFYRFAQNTLEYADTKNGKSVKIALDMVKSYEKNISFYDNPEEIKAFLSLPIPNSSFDGYVIYKLDAFLESGIRVKANN